ncbi:hypothetical protein HHI36_008244 [Cryptolaemus montrouzieri]|uniref:Uncharacterized protein n=1 Tax=Cryptolaemus montrouzieri TaxID=559131 RepID=A0ABD2MRS5_9CUCU
MCEININNFDEKFPEIKTNLQTAKFIGLDLEFSALNPLNNYAPSLFDNPRKRYEKLRKNVEFTIPIQIGLTAFQFDADKNRYDGNTYTFYVKPGLFSHINRYFFFESSSLEFLALYNFDFNKFVYSGIPYINHVQENDLKSKLAKNEISEANMNLAYEVKLILESQFKIVSEWYKNAKTGDFLTFPKISKQFKNNIEFKYFFIGILGKHLKIYGHLKIII